MDLQKLVVPLILANTEFLKGIDESKNKASGLVAGLSSIGGGVVLGAAGLATAGIGALTAGIIKSTKAAGEAESIQAQLNAVLASTGGIAGISADKVNSLATKWGGLTKFEDDAIVSGENMLLTFTNIGADGGIFDQTTEIMLDMSQAMGTDLQGSAIQLGKALNDPTQGLTALSRVGVAFTDEQKEMIKTLQESGDMVGAQQIILDELKKEFGGSAEAAGKTFTGALEIAKNSLGNIWETIGGKLLPVLTTTATKFATFINAPETQAKIQVIGTAIADFVGKVVEFIPKAIETFQNIVSWLQNNQPIVLGILVALGVAVGIWAVTTAIAGITAMAPFLPVIGILMAIAAVVAIFASAWKSNFLGIRTTVTNNFALLKKVFDGFLVVIKSVGNWIGQNLSPAFNGLSNTVSSVVNWIGKLADKISNIKLPKWMQPGSPMPLEIAMRGLNKELQKSASSILPQFSAQLNIGGNLPASNFNSSQTKKDNNSELIKAIKNLSKDNIDYDKLSRKITTAILKEV